MVPPAGRLGVCGAPVASSTLVTSLAAGDRVCPHCIDRISGKRKPVQQPPARAARRAPPPAATVVVEISAKAGDLLAGTLDPVSRRVNGQGALATFAIPLEHAVAVAEVLAEAGCRSDGRTIREALRAGRSA